MGPSKPLIIAGAIVFCTFVVLGFGGFDALLHMGVSKVLVLTEGTQIWDLWRTMPLPIFIKFRFFNITNPQEFSNGAKANIVELGPYTYLEDWEKVDLAVNSGDDTIRYRMTKTYFFQPHLSNGTEEDMITFINIIFVATAKMAHEFTEEEFMLTQLDGMLADKGEALTKQGTVREILFDGVSVQSYLDLFTNPILQDIAMERGAALEIPENIADGKFGIFKGKNGTDDGYFVVKSGVRGSEEVAQILSYDGHTILNNWRGKACNTIRGTDGTFFPPFVTKESIIYIFAPAMCRSFSLQFHEESETRGVQTYKFVASLRNWMAPKSNQENWCFCPEVKNQTGVCQDDGVFNLSPCKGAPILLSQPHFYGAEEWIQKGVDGLNPDFEKHMTIMNFHPLTGSPVEAAGRMQLSIELTPYDDMPTFSEVSHAVIPFAWLEEGSGLQGDKLSGLRFLDGLRSVFWYMRFLFMAIGLGMIGSGIFLLTRQKKGPPTKDGKKIKARKSAQKPAQGIQSDFTYPQMIDGHM